MGDKKVRYQKELNCLRNKMGKNLAWFDALPKREQFDFLFLWKRHKYQNKDKDAKPKLRHFITDIKRYSRFRPKIQDYRNVVIDMLLKN